MEVTYTIHVEQDDTPVRGYAMASGDDAADKAYEDEILERLDAGDVWAWAFVTVVAEANGFEGSDSLGGCSYASEADFKAGGYYEEMCKSAREQLLCKMARERETTYSVEAWKALPEALRNQVITDIEALGAEGTHPDAVNAAIDVLRSVAVVK